MTRILDHDFQIKEQHCIYCPTVVHTRQQSVVFWNIFQSAVLAFKIDILKELV